ncbi:MAG: GNAT family N-acetyltransferase [Burkholderiaceae bacterium]
MTPFQDLRIETSRLLLRPLADGDADDLWAIFSDPAVMRYWSTPPWAERAQAQRLIDADREALAGRRDLRLGLALRDGGRVVGTLSLYKIDAPCRRADIGYALGAAHQGRGLMNEALAAVIDLAFDHAPGSAFDDLRLNRIEADIDPRNGPSCRALERLGFRLEGRLRERWWVAGEVSDSAMYGLLHADWLNGHPASGYRSHPPGG